MGPGTAAVGVDTNVGEYELQVVVVEITPSERQILKTYKVPTGISHLAQDGGSCSIGASNICAGFRRRHRTAHSKSDRKMHSLALDSRVCNSKVTTCPALADPRLRLTPIAVA